MSQKKLPNLSSAALIEKDGTTGLVGFLKAVYEHIRKEVAAVTVFDGDDAGIKARKELQGFFSGRGEFSPNKDFVSVRSGFPIEGIFPDSWILQCNKEHPGWFKSWSVDVTGSVEPFGIEDDKKENYARYMCAKVVVEENPNILERLINLMVVIDGALAKQLNALKRAESSFKMQHLDLLPSTSVLEVENSCVASA